MTDHKELFLFGRAVPGKADESAFIERLVDAANNRNRNGSKPIKAIASIPANDIQQLVVGQNSIGFLFSDKRIARLNFEIVENVVSSEEKSALGPSSTTVDVGSSNTGISQPGSSGIGSGNGNSASQPPAPSGFGSSSSAANRTAKIRRLMVAARRPGAICGRTGVIVDRTRATLPASSIPEELIAQAQVVLQGKSREVIVRELQRTNLNVNEAVNNLLSRDDDEDDLDEAGEYLHEELLSLLDAGLRGEGGTAVIEGDSLYGNPESYEYLIGQDRRRAEQKSKDRKSEIAAPVELIQENFKFADELQFWHDQKGEDFPSNVKGFTKIAATHSSLYAIGTNGKVYTWDWTADLPSNKPHCISEKLAKEDGVSDEKIVDFEACSWRIAVLTNKNRVASFVDDYCGESLSSAFYTGFIELPSGLAVSRLLVCPLYAAILATNSKIYWWGVYPFAERIQMFENVKKKGQELSNRNIVIGSEVRTRAIPIYMTGSVAVNFSSGVPLIGVLMESAWTICETCRFRVFTPEQYSIYVKEKSVQSDNKAEVDLNQRKRPAPSDDTLNTSKSSAQFKEDAWSLRQVTFFYEEPVCDTAVVKIIDGSYVGIAYKSAIEQNERENNGVVDEGQLYKSIRLIRKDELIVVPTTKISRSPQIYQRKLNEIKLPKRISRILSAVIDNNCFRILAEKTTGDVSLITTNSNGSDVSERHLPLDPSVLSSSRDKNCLALENYGDEDLLVLRDANGSIVPLIPDSSNGYCEPTYIGFGPSKHLSTGLRFISSSDINCSLITSNPIMDTKLLRKSEASKLANRLLLLATLIAPEPRTTEPKIDSLIQNIQYCNLKKVNEVLQELENADENERRFQVLEPYTDGGRNIFHTAVMNAFSTTNRDQGDDYSGVEIDESGIVTLTGGSLEDKPKKDSDQFNTSEADAVSMKFDQRWQEMISGESNLSKIISASPSSSTKSSSKISKEQEEERQKDTTSVPMSVCQRQKNAIIIISALASSNVVKPYFLDLMRQRDLNGYTPFYSAIQMRAYSAALIMWKKMYQLEKEAGRVNPNNLSELAFSGVGNDSSLFLLCYNDTCSFTYTGEEHINQDIFECKTCDLVGSLCCCTECAFSCHRDHDCKLKRTSPTAYCDCWEKCGCKALVAGNQTQRENLLSLLLEHTNLINLMNSRNEHLLLFLARTVGRQLVEQDNFPRRNKIRSTTQTSSSNNNMAVPEHNLEPPKFAITALLSLLGRWSCVKSLLQIGMKEKNVSVPIAEDLFHLNEQNGANHLDKFIFTLLARCPEPALDALLNTLVREANRHGSERDSTIDQMIGRFVRSVVRLFSFLCISSQHAMNTILSLLGTEIGESSGAPKHQLSSSVQPSGSSKNLLPSYRTITVSGVLSLVRTSLPMGLGGSSSSSKENKKKQINNFVLKCKRVFQVLITYSLTELLNSSDALIAPVRSGVAKQGIAIHRCTGSTDPLEYIEKYLYSENEYSTTWQKSSKHKRRFRNQVVNVEEEKNSDESDTSDSESPSQRRSTGPSFAANIAAENLAENAISEAFRDAGVQGNSNDDQNNDLSDDSISASDQDEDMEHQHDFEQAEDLDQSNESGDDDHEHYMGENDDHYFRIDEDVVDESADDYSGTEDDEHYSESEHSPMYDQDEQPPFEDVSDIQLQSSRSATASGSQRRKHPRRHRRSTTNQSDQHANESEQAIDQDAANTGQSTDQTVRSGSERTNDQNSTTANAPESSSNGPANGETSSRSQPRNVANFRSLFIGESSSPNRSTTQTGQTSYTTQSPSIGWAVSRVRQQNDESAANSANSLTDRNPTLPDNNNAESSGIAVNSRHIKTKHHYNSNENDVFQTKIQLAATFALLTKMMDELLLRLIQHEQYAKQSHTGISHLLELRSIAQIASNFKTVINKRLEVTWEWFTKIMDKIEVMLRFGNALLKSPVGPEISPDMHSAASLNQSRNEKRSRKKIDKKDEQHSSSGKREFFGYFMSLMRAHSSENGDEMPFIDANPFRHIALIAEAYLFHTNISELIDSKLNILSAEELSSNSNEVGENISGKELHRFYRRSNSISYPFITSAESQNAFKYSANETAPLATRSTLLKPEADRSDLFMLPIVERTTNEHINLALEHGFKHPTKMSVAENPVRCEDIIRGDIGEEEPMEVDLERFDEAVSDQEQHDLDAMFGIRVNSTRLAMAKTLGRWGNAMSYLAKAFSEDVIEYCGNDSFNSILLNELGGFLLKHAQFKARMEKYKSGLSKDLNFSQMTRDKHILIADVFTYLNSQYARRTSNSSSNIDPVNLPPLGANRVKATFMNEPGEGSGVVRSFYSAFSESIIEMEYLPRDDSSNALNQSSSSSSRTAFQRALESTSENLKHLESLPLFARTSFGFLAPIPGNNSTSRKSAFRNVGRIIGLCLQQTEICPLPLCRHVLKFILNRPITWYDLVFYDPDMFDSLRSIVYNDSANGPHNTDFYDNLGLSFVIDKPKEEGGGIVELKPGGEKIAVNRDNILEYVYLFVQKRLLGDHVPALESIRQGIFDVIPADSLSGLTSEDLRLILCGTEQVSVRLLESFTTFMDESSCSDPKMMQKMKKWFWSVIEKFSDKEKQDLLFFWTGSPSLPPTEEAFTPLPTVMIRPADDLHLITANTCISRVYVPLYSSKKILRAKLLLSIQAKDFGFV